MNDHSEAVNDDIHFPTGTVIDGDLARSDYSPGRFNWDLSFLGKVSIKPVSIGSHCISLSGSSDYKVFERINLIYLHLLVMLL